MTQHMGQVTYEVHMSDHSKKQQVFHINMLKKWSKPGARTTVAAVARGASNDDLSV